MFLLNDPAFSRSLRRALAALLSLSLLNALPAVAAEQCEQVKDYRELNKTVREDQCIVYTGNQVITNDDLAVLGKLYIQTNASLHFEDNSRLLLSKQGELTNRGNMSFKNKGMISLYQESKLNTQGDFSLVNESEVHVFDKAMLRSSGSFTVKDLSRVIVTEQGMIESLGYFDFFASELEFSGRYFNNMGTVTLLDQSKFTFTDEAEFLSKGYVEVKAESIMEFKDSTRLNSYKHFNVGGFLFVSNNTHFVNRGIFSTLPGSIFLLTDSSYMENRKQVYFNGSFNSSDQTQIKNIGTMIFRQRSESQLLNAARLVNTGNLRNQGKLTYDERQLENHNTFFDDTKAGATTAEQKKQMFLRK